ncbi:GntR family transcriptional regulator [Pantoea sp. B65]|uniref:GntR family transcriptional regulator n=1 Tax=Pantoea sp. B65 TaxID=2813359 RepID=UPI0039B458AB
MSDQSSGQRRPRKSYLEAKKKILALLGTAEFNTGDQIPAERELVAMIGLSRMTLRKILAELVDAGILERRGNQGTWIRQTVIERPLTSPVEQGISQITEVNGAIPGSHLLYFQHASASVRIARLLHIEAGDPIVMMKRLRFADASPFCLETSYLPLHRVPGLTASMLEQHGSLYKLLSGLYHIHIASDEGTIKIATMSEEEYTLLQVPPDTPALVYRGVITDTQGSPVEYLVSVNHPEKVSFKIRNPVMTSVS